MPLKLNGMTPKGGSALTLGKLTVLVGPNNAGKSQTLRDLRDFITTSSNQKLTILGGADLESPGRDEAVREISQRPHSNPSLISFQGVGTNLQRRDESVVHEGWLDQQYAQSSNSNFGKSLLESLGKFWCAFLDAEGRFALAASTDSYDEWGLLARSH
jgi:ABC-type branched-subunit amino acid transport system ATPase component